MERLTRTLSIALLATFLAAVASAEIRSYELAPDAESRLELRVFKTGLMSGKAHVFVFERWTGIFLMDQESPANSQVELEIESGGIVCEDDWLSEKNLAKVEREARGPMLAVEEHPTMRFRSQSFEAQSTPGKYRVRGSLEIRGLAREAVLDISLSGEGGELAVNGAAVVQLRNYGLKPPSAALGMIGTRNEMDFSFQMTARPVQE